MFIHEIFKNADPKRLAMTGESNITYGQLEKAVENYRNTLYAMGIRRGEPQWKDWINDFIDRHQDEINAILVEYQVPLLDRRGTLIDPATFDAEEAS